MAEIARIKVNWTGIPSGPGYTNLYMKDFETSGIDQAIVDGSVAKVDTFLDEFATSINTSISFVVNPTVEIVEDTTGALVRFMSATPDPTRVGTQTSAYAAGVGVCVNWYTNTVRNARRVRGRTFIVPLHPTSYATDGTIDATKLTAWRTAAATLVSGVGVGDLGVWARPTTPGGSDGIWTFATASSINDKVAYLSSRRD